MHSPFQTDDDTKKSYTIFNNRASADPADIRRNVHTKSTCRCLELQNVAELCKMHNKTYVKIYRAFDNIQKNRLKNTMGNDNIKMCKDIKQDVMGWN